MSGTPRTRLSMNTILMNARIFDEVNSIKLSADNSDSIQSTSTTQIKFEGITVKQEPDEESYETKLMKVKQEVLGEDVKVKQEHRELHFDESTMFPPNVFDKLNLSKEQMEQYLSPVKLEMDDDTNSSMDSNSRKSAKRNVFTRESPYKTRQSPYKRPIDDENEKNACGNRILNDKGRPVRQKKSVEMETDPNVLRRRQKQIDYGKNTVGYDLYTKTVPKNERSQNDPQTPNKYLKYSRRGFDGLIKQWRLKLHKYDPPEEME